MASAEANAARDAADNRLDAHMVQMELDGATPIEVTARLINIVHEAAPLEQGADRNAYADNLADTICRAQAGSVGDSVTDGTTLKRRCERMDDEVVDLSFGGSRAEPVVLLDPT